MTARLDRSKPHGTVHGVITDAIHYHQDGLPFDAHGALVGDGLTDEQKVVAERKAKRAKRFAPRAEGAPAEPGATEQADPNAAAAADADDPDGEDDGEPADPGDVNLEAWLTGDAKYLFDAVRSAIRIRYTKDCKTIGDAVEFLVLDEELVDRKRVAAKLLPK